MNSNDEVEIYHIICDISKICREYFYGRKYLPRDLWNEESNIQELIDTLKILKNTFKEAKKRKEM